MTLPHLTKKQFRILILIYNFRFIDRKQIQTILKHKNHRRIHSWLTDLVTKNCIERIYSTKMPENTKPAVYYLGKYGRKHLQKYFTGESTKKSDDEEQKKESNETALYQLTKTYKDSQRTEVFRANCLALVDCYLVCKRYVTENGYTQEFFPLTGCAKKELFKKFDSYVMIKKKNGRKKSYALIYLTHRTPRRFTRYRIAEIIKFFQQEWDYESDQPYPTILIICSNSPIRNYAKKVFESKLEYYGHPELTIRLATLFDFKKDGLDGNIWIQPKNEEEY